MAFTNDYSLAIDPVFQQKVKVCIVKVAHAVAGESAALSNERNHMLRHRLAVRVLNAPAEFVERFSFSAVSDGLLAGGFGDSDLETRITDAFSDMAGCY